jgi:hypothetical protein
LCHFRKGAILAKSIKKLPERVKGDTWIRMEIMDFEFKKPFNVTKDEVLGMIIMGKLPNAEN